MAAPGLKIEDLFKQVRNEVLKASNNQQIPWESSSLTSEFYFLPDSKGGDESEKLKQVVQGQAELIKEMEKLRAELLALKEKAAPAKSETVSDKQQVAIAKQSASILAESEEWGERFVALGKATGSLSLSKALALLLDINSDDGLSLLLAHEARAKRFRSVSAYAMGIDSSGKLIWGAATGHKNTRFAAESAVEYCARESKDICKVVLIDGEFREEQFLELAKLLRHQSIANNNPPAEPGVFRIAAPSKGADRNPTSKAHSRHAWVIVKMNGQGRGKFLYG